MDLNSAIQITLVALAIAGALIWLVVRVLKMRKRSDSGDCCGCGLAEHCKKRSENGPKRPDCGHHGGPTARNSRYSARQYKRPDR